MKHNYTYTILLIYILFAILCVACEADTAADTGSQQEGTTDNSDTTEDPGENDDPPDVEEPEPEDPPIEFVTYREFGAIGDGKTNDISAIIKTHEHANEFGLKVRADEGATYYISEMTAGAVVMTDTDWTGSSFIIDDSNVPSDRLRNVNVFTVSSANKRLCLATTDPKVKDCPPKLTKLTAGMKNIGINLPEDSVITVIDANTKRYVRKGANQNSGSDQKDVILVDKNGNIAPETPLMWDYNTITSAYALPIDTETLTLKGGTFTTVANRAQAKYTYYQRGIAIRRSNTVVDGITHFVTGEADHGAPYSGFLILQESANILVKNTVFTGRKTYYTIGSAGTEVSMGTYDISPTGVLNLTFENCSQTNDILDTTYWGLMGSNFCKNITLKNCTFSRFDAHQGVANVTILDSTLGHQGLNAIGVGTLSVTGTTIRASNSFINLRTDYGATWHGDVIIKNSVWVPARGTPFTNANLFGGQNLADHNFGYQCYMPENITIDGLRVQDENHKPGYDGIYLFTNFNPQFTGPEFENDPLKNKFPYIVTKTVNIKNFKSVTGKKWKLSPNTYMFRNVKINEL